MTLSESLPLVTYVDATSLAWEEIGPGARRKTLFEDAVTGQRTRLVQWDAGYEFPRLDRHPRGEYLYILEGTFVDDNQASGPGTYIHQRPGSEHMPRTPDGCTFLVFVPGESPAQV